MIALTLDTNNKQIVLKTDNIIYAVIKLNDLDGRTVVGKQSWITTDIADIMAKHLEKKCPSPDKYSQKLFAKDVYNMLTLIKNVPEGETPETIIAAGTILEDILNTYCPLPMDMREETRKLFRDWNCIREKFYAKRKNLLYSLETGRTMKTSD